MPDSRNSSTHPTSEESSETHDAEPGVLNRLLGELSETASGLDHQALSAFFENSPDPILLFNEKAELIAKNQRAIQLWDGSDDFIPPRLISEVHKVGASGSPFHEHKKNHLITIESLGGHRYFLPTVFRLLSKKPTSKGEGGHEVIACILKDETVWERSEKIRKNLLSSISHELNTPLTSARLALYLLAEQRIGELNTNQQDLVERAKQDLDREIITIRNVIDMIRAKDTEPGQAEIESLSLHELAEEAIRDFESQIKELSLPVDRHYSNTSPWIEMERETAELIIHQIFASILKYSNEGARLQVASSIEDGHCVLEVTTEHGEEVDFPPADLFTLEMESHRTGKLRCADLGLRVAHEMITPYGGALTSERSSTSGTFRFSFPRLKR